MNEKRIKKNIFPNNNRITFPLLGHRLIDASLCKVCENKKPKEHDLHEEENICLTHDDGL